MHPEPLTESKNNRKSDVSPFYMRYACPPKSELFAVGGLSALCALRSALFCKGPLSIDDTY
jgi:hypothetical protein